MPGAPGAPATPCFVDCARDEAARGSYRTRNQIEPLKGAFVNVARGTAGKLPRLTAGLPL